MQSVRSLDHLSNDTNERSLSLSRETSVSESLSESESSSPSPSKALSLSISSWESTTVVEWNKFLLLRWLIVATTPFCGQPQKQLGNLKLARGLCLVWLPRASFLRSRLDELFVCRNRLFWTGLKPKHDIIQGAWDRLCKEQAHAT